MYLQQLELVNFCQYAYRKFEFHPGLIGVIGANGSGKSNLMAAIRLAITGDNLNAGVKAANIFDRRAHGESSFVRLRLQHGDVLAVIQRNLHPNSPAASLSLNGGKEIVGDGKVTQTVLELIGVGADIVNDIIIVAQDDIFGFLNKTPGVRAAQFQRLFQTDAAGEVYQVLGNYLRRLQIPVSKINLEDLDEHLARNAVALADWQRQIAEIPEVAELERELQELEDQFRRADAFLRLDEQRQRLLAQVPQTLQTLNDLRDKLTAREREVAAVRQAADSGADSVEEAKRILAMLPERRRMLQAYELQLQEVTQTETLLSELQPPAPPVCYAEDWQQWQTELEEIQQLQNRLHDFVSSFNKGVAACPTCGTPTTVLADRLEASRQQLKQLTASRDALTEKIAACRRFEQENAEYQRDLQLLQKRQNRAQEMLQSLAKPESDEVDEQKLQETVKSQAVLDAGLREGESLCQKYREQISHLDGQLLSTNKQLSDVERQLGEIPQLSAAETVGIQSRRDFVRQQVSSRRQAETALIHVEADRTRLLQLRSDAEDVHRQAEQMRSWIAVVEQMRSVVHNDGAPRFVAQRNLQRLQGSVNEILRLFETDFSVEASQGLSFTASFHGGPKRGSIQAAERLSWGEKTVLALAFRIALNLQFADHIGALYLDEPTAHLDKHHIRGFEPVLGRLRDFASSRGLQCFIVTHEEELSPLFDAVISI